MHWHVFEYHGSNAAREWVDGVEYAGRVTADRAMLLRLRNNGFGRVTATAVDGYDAGFCDDRCRRFQVVSVG